MNWIGLKQITWVPTYLHAFLCDLLQEQRMKIFVIFHADACHCHIQEYVTQSNNTETSNKRIKWLIFACPLFPFLCFRTSKIFTNNMEIRLEYWKFFRIQFRKVPNSVRKSACNSRLLCYERCAFPFRISNMKFFFNFLENIPFLFLEKIRIFSAKPFQKTWNFSARSTEFVLINL